ncbi:uncharacterized protein DNG_01265 [Cephalotrichum gorgonifer]|uniref:Letm1 RBD domain-containing protein n=1 Tax=Cephalotrichum gorgonifer TaxID=2041049 RepID=A0AAE8MSS6_9PEZI|nr:uncharacterized protein DNG_01265 [Cephalotrichum gorgonifer]
MATTVCLRTLRGPALTRPTIVDFRPYIHLDKARQLSTELPTPTRPNESIEVVEDGLNPPISTLPPPLTLPTRQPEQNTFSHLFALGKAYLGFYKAGFKSVFANRKLLNAKLAQLPPAERPSIILKPHHVPATFSRADWILLWRTKHDVARLPIFGLTVLLFEELTPLIAYLAEGIMPYTCRLPSHSAKSRGKAVERRKLALQELKWKNPDGIPTASVAQSHILRSLNLISGLWDRVGLVPPGLWLLRGRTQMGFLEADDRLLRKAGKLKDLSEDELLLACAERGIDVDVTAELAAGKNFHHDRRRLLNRWLELTDGKDTTERRKRMAALLALKPEDWPATSDFPLPSWEI